MLDILHLDFVVVQVWQQPDLHVRRAPPRLHQPRRSPPHLLVQDHQYVQGSLNLSIFLSIY